MTFTSRYDLITIQWMKFYGNYCINRTLWIENCTKKKRELFTCFHSAYGTNKNVRTRVSVILCPFSPRCHSHTDIILSGESSIAASRAPLSARLKHKLFTEPVNSPYPITAIVANDTEFHTLT